MKAYQLIYITSYTEYDEGFSFHREDYMPGNIFLHREKAEAEKKRILHLPLWEQYRFRTRCDGYLSDIKIKEWNIIE